MKLLKVIGYSTHALGAGLGLTGIYVLFSGEFVLGAFTLVSAALAAAMAEGVMS